jgi:glycerol-3-phosphate acyltransferase PlsY
MRGNNIMWAAAAMIAGAYLVGSLPHLQWLAKLCGIDLSGDYHQDLWHRGGKVIGVAGVIGEFAKGIIAVLVARALDFDIAVVAFAGVAAVCGQMWPVFTRFDGEKGNSIALAMMVTLVPVPGLVALIPALAAVIIRTASRLMNRSSKDATVIGGAYSRVLPVGMLICFLVLPFSAWGFGEDLVVVISLAALFVLIMVRRLTAGLGEDLESGNNVGRIVLLRMLYDRASVSWRG